MIPLFLDTVTFPAGNQVTTSIVAFSAQEEPPFLLYSKGSENGPGIRRTGDTSPAMRRRDRPWEWTTDPEEQRSGTWYATEAAKRQHVADLTANGAPPAKLVEAHRTLAYDDEFTAAHTDYHQIGQIGFGDLTMNLWHVAYLRSKFTAEKPELLYLPEEPIDDRTYVCMVKTRDGVRIEPDVRFNRYDSRNQVNIGGTAWEPEFAFSGKPVILDGKILEEDVVVQFFGDIRHLLHLANLNPNADAATGKGVERPGQLPVPGKRPRYYFGRDWVDDVWLGEKQLLDDWNLQRSALRGAIILDRLHAGLGASVDHVRGALVQKSYEEMPASFNPLNPGQFRFVAGNDRLVEIRWHSSCYPWNLIGITEDRKFVVAFASNGFQGKLGGAYTLRQACEKFIAQTEAKGLRVHHALLINEGNDVFQRVRTETGWQEHIPVHRNRPKLRATIAFGHLK